MNRIMVSVSFLVPVLVSALVLAETTPQDLASALTPVRERFEAPAVSAAVVRDGQVIGQGVSGVRGASEKTPVAIGDRTLIGSCGKSLTRLLIARLVDQGKLRFDSTLAELLPDVAMRDEYKSVTIEDVMSFKGGIQPYTRITPQDTPIMFNLEGKPREQRAQFIAHVLNETPVAAPRTKWVYSNAAYSLLGHLAERVADRPFEELLRDEVFKPIGMDSAVVGAPFADTNIPGWYGHQRTPEGFKQVARSRGRMPAMAPAGLMSCSIGDFAKMGAALVAIESGKPLIFLSPEVAKRLPELRPGDDEEGVPFFGGDGQYTAVFALWPSKNVAIIAQTNAGDSDDVCRALVEAARAAVAPDVPAFAPMITAGKGKYGLRIQTVDDDDDQWEIASVEPDSIGAQAGLKSGDRITAIDGKPLADLAPRQRLEALKKSPVTIALERDAKEMSVTLQTP